MSIGFNPDYIVEAACNQDFQIGKCIYDDKSQQELISQVVDEVEILAGDPARECPPSTDNGSYREIFKDIERDLLRIAAVLKHPSFREEEEWRVISPVITDYVKTEVRFREGNSMLVPFINFSLPPKNGSPIALEHLFLGPTPNINISMNSLDMFLSKNSINPSKGISYCQIPFRLNR